MTSTPHRMINGIVGMLLLLVIGSATARAQMEISLKDGRTVKGNITSSTDNALQVSVYSESRKTFSTVTIQKSEIVSVFDPISDRDVTREVLGSRITPTGSDGPSGPGGSSSTPSTETPKPVPFPTPSQEAPSGGDTPKPVPFPSQEQRRDQGTQSTAPVPFPAQPSHTAGTSSEVQRSSGSRFYKVEATAGLRADLKGTTMLTPSVTVFVRPEGYQRDDEYRTGAAQFNQPTSHFGVKIQYGPTYDGAPTQYNLSPVLNMLVGKTLGVGVAGIYESAEKGNTKATSFVAGPIIQLYTSSSLTLTAYAGLGQQTHDVMYSFYGNVSTSTTRLQLEHTLAYSGSQSLGYAHRIVLFRVSPSEGSDDLDVAGRTVIQMTNAVEIAPSAAFSIQPQIMTTLSQVLLPRGYSADPDAVFSLSPGLGLLLSPSNAVTLTIMPSITLTDGEMTNHTVYAGLSVRF